MTDSEELKALADREAAARRRYNETDKALIRESKLIEGALRLASQPSADVVRMREALELAYGLLWVVGCDRATLGGNALYLARKALLEQLDKAGQGRGITAARKALNDEGAASGARYRVCCPADFYTLPRTGSGTSDASIGGGASGSLAALRDDGDSEGAASADGLSGEQQCGNTDAYSTCAATSSDRPTSIRSSSTSTAHVTELPENVRIPLNSLQADLGYLIGRVIADGSCGPMIQQSIAGRLNQIEEAVKEISAAIDALVPADGVTLPRWAVDDILKNLGYIGDDREHLIPIGLINLVKTALAQTEGGKSSTSSDGGEKWVDGERETVARALFGDGWKCCANLGPYVQSIANGSAGDPAGSALADARIPDRSPVAPPDWLWWGEVDGKDVVTFGRWPKRGARWRYKIAAIQPTEHDDPAINEAVKPRIVTTSFDEVECEDTANCSWPECECPRKEPPRGTFACPICGKDTPHHHAEVEIALRKEALRKYYAGMDHHPVYRRIFIDGGLFILNAGLSQTADVDAVKANRPFAFAVKRAPENGEDQWRLFMDEGKARAEAEQLDGEYEGLYRVGDRRSGLVASFESILASLHYDGTDINSLTVGELRRALR